MKKIIISTILILCIACLAFYFTTHKTITKGLTAYVEETLNIELSDVATSEDGKVEITPREDFAYICISLEKGSLEEVKNRLDTEGNGIFLTEQGFNSMSDVMWEKLKKENTVCIYNKLTEGKTFLSSTHKTRVMNIYLSVDDEGNEFLYLFG